MKAKASINLLSLLLKISDLQRLKANKFYHQKTLMINIQCDLKKMCWIFVPLRESLHKNMGIIYLGYQDISSVYRFIECVGVLERTVI